MPKALVRLLLILAATATSAQANAAAVLSNLLSGSTGDVSFFPHPVTSGDGDVTQASDMVVPTLNPAFLGGAREIAAAFGYYSQKFMIDLSVDLTGGNAVTATGDVTISFAAFAADNPDDQLGTPFVTHVHLLATENAGDFDAVSFTQSTPVLALAHDTDPEDFEPFFGPIDFRFSIEVSDLTCTAVWNSHAPNPPCTATVSVRDPLGGEDPIWGATGELSAVPEPASGLMLAAGSLGLVALRRRRR